MRTHHLFNNIINKCVQHSLPPLIRHCAVVDAVCRVSPTTCVEHLDERQSRGQPAQVSVLRDSGVHYHIAGLGRLEAVPV